MGGYSASAYISIRLAQADNWQSDTYQACYDFLARPSQASSQGVRDLLDALTIGDVNAIERARTNAEQFAAAELAEGPDEWIAHRVYASLLNRFIRTNLRAVLPDGTSSKWDPLVSSFLNRERPVWDFFPSQIAAIEAGLLTVLDRPTAEFKALIISTQ